MRGGWADYYRDHNMPSEGWNPPADVEDDETDARDQDDDCGEGRGKDVDE